MPHVLQDYVPYEQSLCWQLHESYYNSKGIEAFTGGDIPSYATNNYPIARQHARLITEVYRQQIRAASLTVEDEVVVLELGAGSGGFAANLLRALEVDCGPDGRALLARLTYVLSDYSRATLETVLQRSDVAPWVSRGRIRLAALDMRDGRALQDGSILREGQRLSAVMANYMVCVSPIKALWRGPESWSEMHLRFEVDEARLKGTSLTPAEVVDKVLSGRHEPGLMNCLKGVVRWVPGELDEIFGGAFHAEVVRQAASAPGELTICYPTPFIDFLARVWPCLDAGGVVLLNDFGRLGLSQLRGCREPPVRLYGNSINHEVHFAVFDGLAKATPWHVVASLDPLASLHHVMLGHEGTLPDQVVDVFQRLFVDTSEAQHVLDLRSAARALIKEEPIVAARFWEAVLQLDPLDDYARRGIADACLRCAQPHIALAHLRAGTDLPSTHDAGYALLLSRAYHELDQGDEALVWANRALESLESPDVFAQLGRAHILRTDVPKALQALSRALELDPSHAVAQAALAELKDSWWSETTKRLLTEASGITSEPQPPVLRRE